MRDVKKRLRSENYNDIERRFKASRIDLITTGLVVKDLEKYWTALDR